jgi:biofilm PGA synthesis N-glycosyltransferase PgaC
MTQRLLVVSPVRNEAAHIERVALAMAAQTRRPDLWVVIDDRSTDETPQILARLASQLDFMQVLSSPEPQAAPAEKDRLAVALEARAFNLALASVPWQTFTHIAKLDGDIELSPRYFELLLAEFERDPELGLAGGTLSERTEDGWTEERAPSDYHVRGALKCFTRACLESIGGIQERLAWDTIDEVYARMHGFRTRSFAEIDARHHRPWGSADGTLRGRARHGRCVYITHFPLAWVSLRAVKTATESPQVLSGLAFLGGYLWAGVVRTPQVEDPAFRAFVRRELSVRARRALKLGAPVAQAAG